MTFIVLLAIIHLLLFFFGSYFIPMVLMVFFWGLVHTGGFLISNVNVTSSATEAPEFVNSIFTSCGNLAVTFYQYSPACAVFGPIVNEKYQENCDCSDED